MWPSDYEGYKYGASGNGQSDAFSDWAKNRNKTNKYHEQASLEKAIEEMKKHMDPDVVAKKQINEWLDKKGYPEFDKIFDYFKEGHPEYEL